jgi:hypothetical protein
MLPSLPGALHRQTIRIIGRAGTILHPTTESGFAMVAKETPDPSTGLERKLRELELEKREEELRQLKANAKVNWITPAAVASLLPLAAAFGVWIFGEVKQFNAGYQALRQAGQLEKEKAQLREDNKELEGRKTSLNIEIQTLLQLKEHYAKQAQELRKDVEAKQEAIDLAYLAALYHSNNSRYALGHVRGSGQMLDRKAVTAIDADLKKLPTETEEKVRKALDDNIFMLDMIDVSQEVMSSFQDAIKLVPASDWARRLTPVPSGGVIDGRDILVEYPAKGARGERHYDLKTRRFLTAAEIKAKKVDDSQKPNTD